MDQFYLLSKILPELVCTFCLGEIPYSIELKKGLEGVSIRFIYLAYNDRIDNWKKAG